jgi:hypothetical protein
MERFSAAPRIGSNVAGSYETRQSGLPDVASQSLDDLAKSGSPPSGRSTHYQKMSKRSGTSAVRKLQNCNQREEVLTIRGFAGSPPF